MGGEALKMKRLNSDWEKIARTYGLLKHNFALAPFHISAKELKEATNNREPRLLCYHNTRSDRPRIFQDVGLFILPVKNGHYAILRGEGFVDLPPIEEETLLYSSSLDFSLETSRVGDSEMQHLDYAYATSLLRTFLEDRTLLLTIRGRKRTPEFAFRASGHELFARGVQTEVDGGYEGRTQIVLVEAKNRGHDNMNIRQMYYPFRQWSAVSKKPVKIVFFENDGGCYKFWHFVFLDPIRFNSLHLVEKAKYRIVDENV